MVLFAVLFLAPVFLQQIQHHSATVTGLVPPQGIVMGLASWLGSVVIERGKARPAVITFSIVGGFALLATLYASRAAATGDPLAALHDCVLVLTVAAAVGAVAAACNHGVSASDAGFARGGRHGCRHHSAAASQRADQAVPTGQP